MVTFPEVYDQAVMDQFESRSLDLGPRLKALFTKESNLFKDTKLIYF